MRKIVCKIKGHKRGDTWYKPWLKEWHIECERCGHIIEYRSPHARLIGTELKLGFDGN